MDPLNVSLFVQYFTIHFFGGSFWPKKIWSDCQKGSKTSPSSGLKKKNVSKNSRCLTSTEILLVLFFGQWWAMGRLLTIYSYGSFPLFLSIPKTFLGTKKLMHSQLLHDLQEFIWKERGIDAKVLDLGYTICHSQDLGGLRSERTRKPCSWRCPKLWGYPQKIPKVPWLSILSHGHSWLGWFGVPLILGTPQVSK